MSFYTCIDDKTLVTGIGTTTLKSSYANILLKDVLLVTTTTKNLSSVQRLTKDNPIHVHFTDSFCVVKDNINHQPLV